MPVQEPGDSKARDKLPRLLRRLMDDTSAGPADLQAQIDTLSNKLEKWGADNYWSDNDRDQRLGKLEKFEDVVRRLANDNFIAHVVEIVFIAICVINLLYFWCVPG